MLWRHHHSRWWSAIRHRCTRHEWHRPRSHIRIRRRHEWPRRWKKSRPRHILLLLLLLLLQLTLSSHRSILWHHLPSSSGSSRSRRITFTNSNTSTNSSSSTSYSSSRSSLGRYKQHWQQWKNVLGASHNKHNPMQLLPKLYLKRLQREKSVQNEDLRALSDLY